MKRIVPLLGLSLAFAACVPKGQYLRLQEKNRQTEARLADESSRADSLEAEVARTKNTVAALEKNLRELEEARDQAIRDLEAALVRARQDGSAKAVALEEALMTAKQDRDRQVAELQSELERAKDEARKKAEELAKANRTYEDLLAGLQQEIDDGRVTISNLRGKLTVNLIDKILFDSGSADLNAEGKQVLTKVSDVLKKVEDRRISVEGHTDDVPIARAAQDRFASNWELSTLRASTVVRHLIEQGVPPEKLSAAGYSMYMPVVANDSPDNRRLNRRIEIVLLPVLKE
jgi:chemotaxis protein MotB